MAERVGATSGATIGVGIGAGRLVANILIVRLGVRGVTKLQSGMYTCAHVALLICIGLYGLY